MILSQCGDAQINLTPLVIAHLHPPRDLIESAQAAATHLITQNSGAMTRARRTRCYGDKGSAGLSLHGSDYTCR
jgi:hypothetical protein